MLSYLASVAGKTYDWLFPRRCVGCGREGGFLCSACQASLSPIEPPFCPRCGLPRPVSGFCPVCTGWETDIDGIRGALRFEGAARQMVYQLKYHNLRAIVPEMVELIIKVIPLNTIPGDIIVPVPLHPQRLRERGYNQSALIARELTRRTGLELGEECLIRNRNTPSQAHTRNVAERRDNVRGVFSCRNGRIKGRRVILVDDVATSGATLNAGAVVLKRAGALSVRGLTFAREV